jgi:hypothetical protein
MKLYWGVFSQNLKRVAVFEFDQQKEAQKRATELSKGGKSPHFIQKVKEEISLEYGISPKQMDAMSVGSVVPKYSSDDVYARLFPLNAKQ